MTIFFKILFLSLLLITFPAWTVAAYFDPPEFPVKIRVPDEYPTIAEAVENADHGHQIILAPGVYEENVELTGVSLILRSENPADPAVVESTIIKAAERGAVITFDGEEGTTSVLAGLTLTGGFSDSGGGIDGSGTTAAIRDCLVTSNTAEISGAGIFNCHGLIMDNRIIDNRSLTYGGGIGYSAGTIRSNIIEDNLAEEGGGLYQCFGLVQGNRIMHNRADFDGGGLAGCSGLVRDNLIAQNYAHINGGGLVRCDAALVNNTIADNTATSSGASMAFCRGFQANQIIRKSAASPVTSLHLCSPVLYSCLDDNAIAGKGNIVTDPEFADAPAGDYRLLPGSPCIDAGNSFYIYGEYISDQDGNCRIWNSSTDMGCYEFNAANDRDGDLLSDIDEDIHQTDSENPDSDFDGLKDGVEVLAGGNPAEFDFPGTINVPADYDTLQKAIFFSLPGELIRVHPGRYTENLHLLNKSLTLSGTDPDNFAVTEITVINGEGASPAATFGGEEGPLCKIEGLTLTGGFGVKGGGVSGNGATASLYYNIIRSNVSEGYFASGGGIHDISGVIENNRIMENRSGDGGGLASCSGDIRNNVIEGNTASGLGGGLLLCGLRGSITHNIIRSNSAEGGGGLSSCYTLTANNFFVSNQAVYGGAAHAAGGKLYNNTFLGNSATVTGSALTSCRGIIRNNIFSGNSVPDRGSVIPVTGYYYCSRPTYSCLQKSISGEGNIVADPQLDSSSASGYHLSASSPCIDAGAGAEEVATDLEGDPRPVIVLPNPGGDGSGYDMGADEFVPPPPPPEPVFIAEWDFENDSGGWTPITFPGLFTEPRLEWLTSGSLAIISTDNLENFGFWESPFEGFTPETGLIHRARFTLSTNIEDPARVPRIRLRTESVNSQKADVLDLFSPNAGGGVIGTEPKQVDLYFAPPVQGDSGLFPSNIRLSFDLVNFDLDDEAGGAVFLHHVIVEAYDPGDLPILSGVLDLDYNQTNPVSELWQWNEIPEIYTPPFHEIISDGLVMTGVDNRTFGFWSRQGDVSIAPESLLRTTVGISTNVEDTALVPGLRLRFNSASDAWAISLEIYSASDGANSPTEAGRNYDFFLAAPPGLSVGGENLVFSFDMKSFDPGDDLTSFLKLDKADIDLLNPPP